jgi:hypothetical protein
MVSFQADLLIQNTEGQPNNKLGDNRIATQSVKLTLFITFISR